MRNKTQTIQKMMSKYLTLFVALGLITSAGAQSLILQPAPSPDGARIAFTYQGDIWTVPTTGGRADRLTIHEGVDSRPAWSPDGTTISFSSDRYGNNDVYTIPAMGGTPTRLTHHAASDNVSAYSPTGSVLFTTRRVYAQVEREWEIYEAVPDAGTPVRMMEALGFDPDVSPDGKKVAFVRGTCRVSREAYRGPANRNIWVFDKLSGEYTRLTDFDGNDFAPQWIDNNSLLYISSRSGKYNVHMLTSDGSDTQVTSETDFGVNSFSASPAADKIVFQYGDQVAVADLDGSDKVIPEINVSSDFRFDPVVKKKVSNQVDEFAVSPNGKLSAYIHRGDIYITRNDKEDSRSVRVINSPSRDQEVAWLNDETLLYVSDANGQFDLFVARSADPDESNMFRSLKHESIAITNSPEEEFAPVVSPDGGKVAFRRGRGQLLVADIAATGSLSNLISLQDSWDWPGGVSWSPDSKWLAYSLSDLNFNEEIYIHAADNSRGPVNVSMHPKYDGNPVWSPDGSKLGFISQRNNSDGDVWFAWLKKSDWEKSKEAWKREEKMEDEEKDEDKEGSVTVTIDFDGLYKRLTQVTGFAGNEDDLVFDKDGEFIYYSIGSPGRQNYEVSRDLYKIKWDGTGNKEVLGGNQRPVSLLLAQDGDHVYANTRGGKIVRINTKDDKSETLSVSSQLDINYRAEREQVFEEAWRALEAGFYDPGFHGRDWAALKAKYKPIAMKASTKEDFQYIFNLMLGQLNASHMGMRSGENQKETQEQRTGRIGIEGENREDGFEVTSIVPGSPADKAESKLYVGDKITSVNQTPVGPQTNFFSLLTDQIDEPVLLNVQRLGGDQEEIVIWPVSSLSSELYDAWVDERRKLTTEYSGGRLGYLHIRGMNWTSFERFERELTAAGYGKEGIVIDVRYNGGGWTTDYLMAVLNVRQHAYTVPRGATPNLEENHLEFKETYPFGERLPLASWTKPSIALCNENSYSNAEIFSHAFKTLDLGTLVGMPTFGAVISTGGWGLVDGSYVRMPFRAWYVKATEENMEHGPAVPDIQVENPPAYKARNIDPQLKRAVEELLGQIE